MKNRGIQLEDTQDGLQGVDLKIEVIRENGLITQGLVIGDTLKQNQAMIIIANPGELKFNPTIGVAIDELILDNDYLRMKHRIREHLEKDGMKVNSVDFSEGKPLIIEANYE
jgi:hypothetical protein